MLSSLEPGVPLELIDIPIIPGIGGPSIEDGRIATLAKAMWQTDTPGIYQGFDYTVLGIEPPTLDAVKEAVGYELIQEEDSARMQALAIEMHLAQKAIYKIYGVYRSY
jgi:hypothetical protein